MPPLPGAPPSPVRGDGARAGTDSANATSWPPMVPPPGAPSVPTAPAPGDPIHATIAAANVTATLCAQSGGQACGPARVCFYTTQIVAGTNYEVTMSASDVPGSPCYVVDIFAPLPYTGLAPSVTSIRVEGGSTP
uniref:Uncharacterized protein n=1 Tax=Zooxanthella nutricula TaxID=1333877 RepID=A0A7S2M726_9DINO|mmetsp:Transcript_73437/g.224603  ORF Transcript_73437/g.224603 Transcript_73437/m.224603 type:complete len:135 (+) Transcript_73437:3-407(+)